MKQIASAYTYNKTSGVIVLTGVNIDRDQLLLIVNTTRNVTYYNFADSTTTLQAFTQGVNTSVTLATSVVSASLNHTNADALTIYYDDQSGTVTVGNPIQIQSGNISIEEAFGESSFMPISGTVTANVGLNELSYIKANIAITKTGFSGLSVSIFLRRISEYKYESVRYQGDEDEAYITIELVTPAGGQKVWKASYLGGSAFWEGYFAYAWPQNKGYDTGDPFPPTAWTLEAGFTGTTTVSYEQPSTQPISGTVTANVFGLDSINSINAQIPVIAYDEAIAGAGVSYVVPVQISNNDGTIGSGNPLPISGTVTAIDLGAKADAVATTDTGTFSVIAFIKRGLQNWTSLLAKIPTLVSGRIPVDGSGVTQPVSAGATSFFVSGEDVYAHRSVLYSSSGNGFSNDAGAPVDIDNPLPISGTVTANVPYVNTQPSNQSEAIPVVLITDEGKSIFDVDQSIRASIFGTLPAGTNLIGSVSPAQGTTVTNTTFTSITPSTSLVSAVAGRRVLSVFNEGTGVLYISGGVTCTTTSYQVRLGVGEYWECPAGQLSLAHSAVFGTAGSARVSQVT